VFEKHCSTSNTTPASNDVTALAIKPKKHQRLAYPLLQAGVVTHSIRVCCEIFIVCYESSVLGKVSLFGKTVSLLAMCGISITLLIDRLID